MHLCGLDVVILQIFIVYSSDDNEIIRVLALAGEYINQLDLEGLWKSGRVRWVTSKDYTLHTWDLLSVWVLTETNHVATKSWFVNDHPNPLDIHMSIFMLLLLLFFVCFVLWDLKWLGFSGHFILYWFWNWCVLKISLLVARNERESVQIALRPKVSWGGSSIAGVVQVQCTDLCSTSGDRFYSF